MNMIDNAFSGVQAAQIGMNVTSMNIANLLTPGYSRQGMIQSAVGPQGQGSLSAGNGVQVESIRRISNQYLIGQVWQTNSKASYYAMNDQYISALEKVIGTDSTGLSGGLDAFFGSLSALTTQPDGNAERQQLLNQADALAMRFNNVDDFINSQKNSVNSQRDAIVVQINTLSESIAGYNKKIAEAEAAGGNSSTLRDQRDQLVKQMSSLTDVKVSEDGSGGYTVTLKNGQPLVSGSTAGTLTSGSDSNGDPTLSLSFSNSEYQLDPAQGGQLGALYDYQTGPLKEMQASVRGMTEALAKEINDQLAQGYDKNGQPGKPLFVFDPANPDGMLHITDLTPDEIALSGNAGEPGNGDNLQALIDLKSKKVNISGMGNMSINEAAAALIATIGTTSKQNKSELEAAQAVSDQAQMQRDNLSGVNQDEEAINLQVYMQAYQANMKVISAGNQIFNDLLGLF